MGNYAQLGCLDEARSGLWIVCFAPRRIDLCDFMSSPLDPGSTSHSLIRRVQRFEAEAWVRLSTLYGPIVYGWCRRAGLQSSDAADAVQEVFRSVFQAIGSFRGASDGSNVGSFRRWLWIITLNQVRLNARRHAKMPQALGGSDAHLRMAASPDEETAVAFFEPEPDAEGTRTRLLHRTLELVRSDFNESTWTAFSRVILQDHSIQDVAADLGLTENAVRQAKFRVLRRLREELAGM